MELIIIMALALGAMWFMSSKNRKRQQEVVNFRDNLEAGDEVMTTSGLFATVVEVDGEIVVLETTPGVTSRWFKPAISKRAEDVIPVFEDEDDAEYEDGEYEDGEYDEDGNLIEDGEYDEAEEYLEVPDDASSLTDDAEGQGEDDAEDPRA